jgi:hypothetical protein
MSTPDFCCVRSAPWRKQFDYSDCYGDCKSPNFSYPVGSSTGEAGKKTETGLCAGLRSAPKEKKWVAKGKISINTVKMIFSKIVAFKRDYQNIFKYGSGSYCRPKAPPPFCFLTHFLFVNVTLSK